MRIHLLSDLHREIEARDVVVPAGTDVVVAAGDIDSPPARAVRWLAESVRPDARVVYVAGNHEPWKTSIRESLLEARALAGELGVDMLLDEEISIDGVRFAGGTLWTDYRILGAEMAPLVRQACRDTMRDHRRITWAKTPAWQRFRPEEAILLHHQTRLAIEAALSRNDGPLVVVTHHAPSPLSLRPQERGTSLSGAYGSDLSELLDGRARLWLHGHTHLKVDYTVGGTRIVSNPVGYPDENVGFDPNLILEV